VSSEGSEEGGNYVDFGLLRVGDIAVKKIGLGNKGKYRISYKFVFTRPNLMKYLVLSPMEGVIEAGGKDVAQISMTFTSLEAIQLVSVKHVYVQLIEPATGELVETFPLCISAVSKYSTYRLQPSKGLSFGAVKYDAEPRVKRVELRNEGTYVHSSICACLFEDSAGCVGGLSE
jgi:hydrocephalus-inducing protein